MALDFQERDLNCASDSNAFLQAMLLQRTDFFAKRRTSIQDRTQSLESSLGERMAHSIRFITLFAALLITGGAPLAQVTDVITGSGKDRDAPKEYFSAEAEQQLWNTIQSNIRKLNFPPASNPAQA